MSRRLRDELHAELMSLGRLMDQVRPLVRELEARPPTGIELAALAAMLHAFYAGVENLLKRAAVGSGRSLPSAGDWHAALLNAAAEHVHGSPAVLSKELASRLKPYLQFRHVFRHAYTFDLDWSKLRVLVEDVCAVHADVEREVRAYADQLLDGP